MKSDEKCVSVCGLYCGACPAFPDECHGCLSDFVRDVCKVCKNGFRKCAAEHQITRCSEWEWCHSMEHYINQGVMI